MTQTVTVQHECSVCRQLYRPSAAQVIEFYSKLFGSKAYSVCCCCGMQVQPHKRKRDREAYQRRWDKWKKGDGR